MDIFKQKRYQLVVIIILVILNMSTLLILILGKPAGPPGPDGPRHPGQEQAKIKRLLKSELGFNEDQINQYLLLRKDHRKKVQHLDYENRQLKKQLFDEVLEDNPQITISDSLIKLVQEKQGKIERLTFRHFLEIKKLTKPGKQEKLRLIIHGMFRRQPPGADGGPPPRDDMPPPPPNDF